VCGDGIGPGKKKKKQKTVFPAKIFLRGGMGRTKDDLVHGKGRARQGGGSKRRKIVAGHEKRGEKQGRDAGRGGIWIGAPLGGKGET